MHIKFFFVRKQQVEKKYLLAKSANRKKKNQSEKEDRKNAEKFFIKPKSQAAVNSIRLLIKEAHIHFSMLHTEQRNVDVKKRVNFALRCSHFFFHFNLAKEEKKEVEKNHSTDSQ